MDKKTNQEILNKLGEMYKDFIEQSASEMPMQEPDGLESMHLNPCPCGTVVDLTSVGNEEYTKYFLVRCKTCGQGTKMYVSCTQAVRAWNEKTKKKLSAADAINAILGGKQS
jgi:hypothetical protein